MRRAVMETPASLAPGTGGKPLGTERLSALPIQLRSGAGSSGQAFAREVERAVERSRGDGRQQERLEELRDACREARRAGFGRARESTDEAHPVEAVFHAEEGPAAPRPAQAQRAAITAFTAREVAPPAGPTCEAQPRPEIRPESGPAPAAAAPAGEPAAPVAAVSAATRASPEAAPRGNVRPGEVGAAELPPPARAAARSTKPAGAPAQAAGPDPAVLERAAEILRQIQLHATPHVRRLVLEIEPAELGRLGVQLALRAGRVAAIVRSGEPETLALLEQHEAELRAVLARRGIAAESVRFELGFGGSRSGRGQREPAAAQTGPSVPPVSTTSSAPSARAARLDLQA